MNQITAEGLSHLSKSGQIDPKNELEDQSLSPPSKNHLK